MESRVVIKEEQLNVPPGFSPNQETRHGDAATTSLSATASDDGDEPGGPTPIEPDSLALQNPIEDLRHQGSSSSNSAMICVNRKRKPGQFSGSGHETLPLTGPLALAPLPQAYWSDSMPSKFLFYFIIILLIYLVNEENEFLTLRLWVS